MFIYTLPILLKRDLTAVIQACPDLIQVIYLPPEIINSGHHTVLPPCDTWEKYDVLIISTKQENLATKLEADQVITTGQQSPVLSPADSSALGKDMVYVISQKSSSHCQQ